MKLCFIADANSIHTARWIDPLVEAGYEVSLISYTTVKRDWRGLSDLVDLTILFNLTKVRIGVWGLWIARYVRQKRPDILHAHQATGAGWLGAMCNYHPFLVSAWGSDLLVDSKRRGLRPFLLRCVLRTSDLLTVPSPAIYETALGLGYSATKLRYVPWGIESKVFRPASSDRPQIRAALGLPVDAEVVLSPRIVTALYNIEVIVRAVGLLRARYPKVHLVQLDFNPRRDYRDRIERLVAELGLKRNVTWLPAQNEMSEMAKLYQAADVTVSLPFSEGYGFSVFESLACGTPTVISEVAGFDGVLEDEVHTLKVGARDVEATAAAIDRILVDRSLQRQLIRNGLEIVQKHSVGRRIAQVEALYEEVLREGRRNESVEEPTTNTQGFD